MEDRAATFDRAERQAFIARQFQDYQASNPAIPQLIRRVWGLESAGHDFLAAMYPLFEALMKVAEFLGELPRISPESAEEAWEKLHNVSDGVLESEEFDEFRCIIEIEFMMSLDVSVTSEKIKKRVELTFAMILRMIQIERAAAKSS
jgi:hypothetical protein